MIVKKEKFPPWKPVRLHAKGSTAAFGKDKEYSRSLCCSAQIERRRGNFRKQVVEFPVCTNCHNFCVDDGKMHEAFKHFDPQFRLALKRWSGKMNSLVKEIHPSALSPGLDKK